MNLTRHEVLALRAYAQGRRAPQLTATVLGAARTSLGALGLVRDCAHAESPMYVTVTDLGTRWLAENDTPEQLSLFPGLSTPRERRRKPQTAKHPPDGRLTGDPGG